MVSSSISIKEGNERMDNVDPATFKGQPVALLTAAQGVEYTSESKLDTPLSVDYDISVLIDQLTTKLVDAPETLRAYIFVLQGIHNKDIKPIRMFGTTAEMLSFKHSGIGGTHKYNFLAELPDDASAKLQKSIERAFKKFAINERHSVHAPADIPLYTKEADCPLKNS